MKQPIGIAITGVLTAALLAGCSGDLDVPSVFADAAFDEAPPSLLSFEPDPLWEFPLGSKLDTELGLGGDIGVTYVGDLLIVHGDVAPDGSRETVVIDLVSGDIIERFEEEVVIDGMTIDMARVRTVDDVGPPFMVGEYEDGDTVGLVAFSHVREILWRAPIMTGEGAKGVNPRSFDAQHVLFDYADFSADTAGLGVLDLATGDILWQRHDDLDAVGMSEDVIVVAAGEKDDRQFSAINWRSDELLWEWRYDGSLRSMTDTHLIVSALDASAVVEVATGEVVTEIPIGFERCNSAAPDLVVCRTDRPASDMLIIEINESGVSVTPRFDVDGARYIGIHDGQLYFADGEGYLVAKVDDRPTTVEFPGEIIGGIDSHYITFIVSGVLTVHRVI